MKHFDITIYACVKPTYRNITGDLCSGKSVEKELIIRGGCNFSNVLVRQFADLDLLLRIAVFVFEAKSGY